LIPDLKDRLAALVGRTPFSLFSNNLNSEEL